MILYQSINLAAKAYDIIKFMKQAKTITNTTSHKTDSSEFSWIKLSPRLYMKRAQVALEEKRIAMEAVKGIPTFNRNFYNTAVVLEFADQQLAKTWGWLEFLMNVKPDSKSRELAKEAIDYLQNEYIELDYDEEIYKLLAFVESSRPKLFGAERKLFSDMMRSYRRMGFGLTPAKRNAVKKYTQQLAKLNSDFRKNINDYKDFILVAQEELDGLSDNYISGLQKVGDNYRISLEYPEYVPFMENATNEAKREELGHKQLRKGGSKNIVVLKKMVALRNKIAQLLGYNNHAEYVLEVKMAKNPRSVEKFLHSLTKPLKDKVVKDIQKLHSVKRELSQDENAKLMYYDIAYAINQDKKQSFQVDEDTIREYFPLGIVTSGMFKVYEKLLSVEFKQIDGIPVWHKDVQTFAVTEKKTGELLAYFFLDLFPREGKYGHAAVFPIVPGLELPGGDYQKPIVGMVCNFNKPSKKNPSLLSHDEVATYFHEFGHVVHGVLTKAKYGSQSGTSVQRDFVEAPSQMLENWVWDEKILTLLSGHYKNHKQKLPKKLLRNMIRAKYHMVAYASMRQLIFSLFDITLHTSRSISDSAALYAQLVKEYTGLDLPKDQIFPAGFGHLEGYDAGYYGYMWSKVFASDMFTRFAKEGLLNPITGTNYRDYILAPGSSEEASELIQRFLGRKPNNQAFLKEIGVK